MESSPKRAIITLIIDIRDNLSIHSHQVSIPFLHLTFFLSRSLSALKEYLATERNVDVESLMNQIKDLIVKTFISIEPYISAAVNMFVPHRYFIIISYYPIYYLH